MASSYIPGSESGKRDWANVFAALISENPGRFNLVPADAVTIQSYADGYDVAFLAANDPATRGLATITAKDSAMMAMLGTLRPYAQRISADAGVSNEDKVSLGVPVRKTTRTPIDPPASRPVLTVVQHLPGEHRVRFTDSDFPTSRAKPFGVVGMKLFVAIAAEAVEDPALAREYALVTRQRSPVLFDVADNGKTATYFGCWVTTRGEVGNWSSPVSVMVAF